ncbi:putative transporter [Trachipleistophora hominis]|uniref:Putative transporter n=1 Tax=Trachipleistophora hominis TaxID=72359 RepID=L7JS97_TRAHO|nr:putative transporter [Trachipleistophora hominis]
MADVEPVFRIPNYLSEVGYGSPFTLIGSLFFEFILLIALYIPIQMLGGFQELLLAGGGMYYMTLHILSYIPIPLYFISASIAFLIMIAVMVFSKNEKFYNLFTAIGSAYIVTYMIVILLNMPRIFVFLPLMIVAFLGFVVFKKTKRAMHYAVCKAILTGFMLDLMIDHLLPVAYMTKSHFSGTALMYGNNLLTIVTFVLAGVMSFIWTCYRDAFMNKVKSFRKK